MRRVLYVVLMLSPAAGSLAADLTPSQAEALLLPVMSNDCGSYYTTQGEPDFANLENKPICHYQPRVTRLVVLSSTTAGVDYNHDRHFDNPPSEAWLKDYAKMEAHETPSLLFRTLRKNLERWRSEGGVDRGERPGQATFKLEAAGWRVDKAPQ
jgi:hypothetical protein